jgi:hypothetical protein
MVSEYCGGPLKSECTLCSDFFPSQIIILIYLWICDINLTSGYITASLYSNMGYCQKQNLTFKKFSRISL